MVTEGTREQRRVLFRALAQQDDPDVRIVDKEPTGFRGELMPALECLRSRGHCKLVLGLRDVLDEPEVLAAEWERKNAVPVTEQFYDEIWVYGLSSVYDPTQGLDLSPEARARMHWTGYLRRDLGQIGEPPEQPYLLVTPGGGGDGEMMVDLVLSAYEADTELSPRAVLVYGPFLSGRTRADFEARGARLNGRGTALRL